MENEFLKALGEGFHASFLQFIKDKDQAAAPKKRAKSRLTRPKPADIEATIDLHGMTTERARNSLLAFLRVARQKKQRCVLIIHGKGSGKVKQEVLHVLREHAGVSHFSKAPLKSGGDGATIAVLKGGPS